MLLSLLLLLTTLTPSLTHAQSTTRRGGDINSPSRYATCTQRTLSIPIKAQNIDLSGSVPRPVNQAHLTSMTSLTWAQNSNFTKAVFASRRREVKGTYKIWTQLCIPFGWKDDGKKSVQVAIHGINFDHTYWEFGLDPSYNYIQTLTKAGHAILTYDRLGVGLSDHPDGLSVVQTPTEVEIAAYLIKSVKNDARFAKSRVIGVGHSYGSITLLTIAATYPTLLSEIILTGFSAYAAQVPLTWSVWMVSIAHELNTGGDWSQYKNDSSYVALPTTSSDLYGSYFYGNYDPRAFDLAFKTRGTLTLGEYFTIDPFWITPATNYTGSLFVLTGDKDILFCGGDGWQKPITPEGIAANGTSLLDDVRTLFPNVSKFSTFLPTNTSHAINQHYTAPETHTKMIEWIEGKYV